MPEVPEVPEGPEQRVVVIHPDDPDPRCNNVTSADQISLALRHAATFWEQSKQARMLRRALTLILAALEDE